MINSYLATGFKKIILVICMFTAFLAGAQAQQIENSYGIPNKTWESYFAKAQPLIKGAEPESFLNYVVFVNDGKMTDMPYFKQYVRAQLKKDRAELIYRIGKEEITTVAQVRTYLSSLQLSYVKLFKEFQANRDNIIESQSPQRAPIGGGGTTPLPFNCGSPCTNPGFESGTGFWNYWTGTACANSTSDPCSLVAGYSPTQHQLQTVGASDPTVGPALPVVPPGGGNNSMMLGDGATTGGLASRATISFTVSAANANFSYKYAVVLQDPVSGHTDPERPFFNVRLRDAAGAVVPCGDYEVLAKPPIVGFTETSPGSAIWWRNWTSVFVPLSSYIGQCVSIQFTSSDCAQGGHFGYAYIDADCDPLQLVASSPAVCGGSSVTLTAPAGGAAYAWSNTAGGTTGIVGSTTGQTAVVNQGGTYQVVITSVSGPACTTTLNITVGTSPSNPTPSFTNTTVCSGGATVFTDTSTPSGSITGWSWDFNADGVSDDITQNPSHTFPGAGTYPVALTITMGPCNATITQNITVNPGVAPSITAAGPFCVTGAPVTLSGAPAGGTWSGTGITNTATGTFDPASATVGNNSITYSVGGACPGTANSVIVVNPLPVSDAGPDVTICSGIPASIGTGTTAGDTYSWSPATGLSAANISNPGITTVNAGTTPIVTTYTVTTTASSCSTTDAVIVTVNPQPVLAITNPPGVCTPNTVDITVAAVTAGSTGGGTLTYWTDAAAASPLAAPTAVAASGTYYIKVTATGGCTDIDPVVVTINPLPVSDAGPDVNICSGIPASIGSASTAGYNYAWLPAAGLSATNVSNPNITTVNAGTTPNVTTYTVTTTVASTGCTTTDDVLVTVNPQPVLAITNPAAVCAPGSVDITVAAVTAGSTGGGTLTYWTDAAATSPLAAPTAVAISGTYYIKVTATGGCTDIDPVVVTINPLPVSDAGPDVTICSGTAASIGSASTAGYNYGWLPATGLSAANVSNPNITTVNAGTTPIVTTYTVTTTVVSTGCTTTDDVLVTVNPQPVLAITNPAAVCSPGTVDITAAAVTAGSTGGGTLTYWTDAAGTSPLAAPTAVATSGTYYIKVTATGGCTDIDPVVVTVNPLPVSDAGPDVTICTGTPASIGSASIAANSYSWSPGTGISATNVSNPSNTTVNGGTSPIVTTYTVTTTVTATGCTTTDDVVVTVNPFPVLATTDPAPVCAPNTVDITAPAVTAGTVGSGVYSYWTNAAATAALASPSAVSASGTYYIQLVSGTGCSDLDSVVVTINPLPVSNAGADLTICTGSSGLIGAPPVVGFSYQWSPVTGLSDPAIAYPTVTLTNVSTAPVSTTYTVTTTNTATGCISVDSTVVTVNPVATANAGSSQSVCSGVSLTLAGAVGGSASGGTWSGGAGTYSPNNNTLNAVYTPSAAEYAAGSVTLTLTTNDPAGPCTFASSSVTFFFFQNPVVSFTVDDPNGCPVHCANFTDQSTVTPGDMLVSWHWDFGDGGVDSVQNPAHCYPITGIYDVGLTIANNHGCTASYTQIHFVEVYAVPVAEFTPVPNPASVLDPEVTLTNGSSPDVISWTYYFGDGDSIAPNVSSPVHLYPSEEPGTYIASLIVINADGCVDTVQKPVDIGPEFTFFIPNAFTPNGDGVNDYFYGQGIGIKKYDIWIFDRWGNMIYHGDDINASMWDGRANHGSEVAQQDVYVWKVKLTDVFDKKHSYIGTVTLVK
jgi:gliding motility-associated-like protein